MGTVTTEALALRRTPFGETSQVAEFMTRTCGRVGLILKGVHRERSRLGGPVDLLDHCRVTWFERRGSRSLAPLRERRVLSNHPGLRSRTDLMAAGLHLVELLRGLAQEGQPMPALFDLSLAYLRALDARPDAARVPLAVFALEGGMLRMTGFEPVLDRCVSCERRPDGHRVLRCDPGRGGVVCSACRDPGDDTLTLTVEACRLAVRLARTDPREALNQVISSDVESELRRLYWRTWLFVLERRPRSLAQDSSGAPA